MPNMPNATLKPEGSIKHMLPTRLLQDIKDPIPSVACLGALHFKHLRPWPPPEAKLGSAFQFEPEDEAESTKKQLQNKLEKASRKDGPGHEFLASRLQLANGHG